MVMTILAYRVSPKKTLQRNYLKVHTHFFVDRFCEGKPGNESVADFKNTLQAKNIPEVLNFHFLFAENTQCGHCKK